MGDFEKMILSKKEAKREGIEYSQICPFHQQNPDQNGVYSCPDCRIIQEPCGCDENMGCKICDNSLIKEVKPNSSHD